MADEIEELIDEYEYPEDILEIGDTKYKGMRTMILALVSLVGYIGAVYAPAFTEKTIDGTGLLYLSGLAFAFFFYKTAILTDK